MMTNKQLEYAAFSAWPALEQIEDKGIVLRYAQGHTKRANSANLLELQDSEYPALIAYIENYFKQKQLPSVIRIPSFTENNVFDKYLDAIGYKYQDKSLVLALRLVPNDCSPVNLMVKSPSDWMQSYCNIINSSISEQQSHLQILTRIKDPIMPVVLLRNGREVACGLAVLHREFIGIFDLQTAAEYRGQGCALQLVNALLQWGLENGASYSYLQVIANNKAAINLYRKLGFEQRYYYWYRVKS